MIQRRPYTPRPYQPLGTAHIAEHPRCALWAGMGMGKGVMALTALTELEMSEDVWPALALGPLRVARDVWTKEPQKWEHLAHIHTSAIIGDEDERRRALKLEAPLYSCNYENVEWLVEHIGTDRWPFKTIIADESRKLQGYRGSYRTSSTGRVFLQGAGGTRARALAKVAHTPGSRFIELTGRPAPQGLTDLWAQAWFIDKGERLGRTYEGFSQRFFRPKYNGFGVEPLHGAEAEIHARLADVCYTLDPRDWFDLREPVINDVYVDLPPKARALYHQMEKDLFLQLEGGSTVEAFGAAAKSQKLMQLANGAVYLDADVQSDEDPRSKKWKAVHDVKLEALESIISEHDGSPMLIAYSHRSDLARLHKLLPKAIDLSVQKHELAFKGGGIDFGLCHPASLGHGVDDIQHVSYTITHFGHTWSLDDYEQINERIGAVRQIQAGFDRAVNINRILARDTVDEDVLERRKGNQSVQEILLAAMKRRLH